MPSSSTGSGRRVIVGRVLGVGVGAVVVAYLVAFGFSLLGVSWVPPVDLPVVGGLLPSEDAGTQARNAPTVAARLSIDREVSSQTAGPDSSAMLVVPVSGSTEPGEVVSPADAASPPSTASTRTADVGPPPSTAATAAGGGGEPATTPPAAPPLTTPAANAPDKAPPPTPPTTQPTQPAEPGAPASRRQGPHQHRSQLSHRPRHRRRATPVATLLTHRPTPSMRRRARHRADRETTIGCTLWA